MNETQLQLLFLTTIVLLPLVPAVVLFRALPSSGEVTGPLKGLQVKFGGAFAGYLILFLCLLYVRPTDFSHYHTWQVRGQVAFDRGPDEPRPNPNDVVVRVTPPELRILTDGRFRFDVPVPDDEVGRPDFPDLTLDLPGYEGVSFSLGPSHAGWEDEVKTDHDAKTRVITIEKISLRSAKRGPAYSETTAQTPQPIKEGGQ
jgi:hypothetical protein